MTTAATSFALGIHALRNVTWKLDNGHELRPNDPQGYHSDLDGLTEVLVEHADDIITLLQSLDLPKWQAMTPC